MLFSSRIFTSLYVLLPATIAIITPPMVSSYRQLVSFYFHAVLFICFCLILISSDFLFFTFAFHSSYLIHAYSSSLTMQSVLPTIPCLFIFVLLNLIFLVTITSSFQCVYHILLLFVCTLSIYT